MGDVMGGVEEVSENETDKLEREGPMDGAREPEPPLALAFVSVSDQPRSENEPGTRIAERRGGAGVGAGGRNGARDASVGERGSNGGLRAFDAPDEEGGSW